MTLISRSAKPWLPENAVAKLPWLRTQTAVHLKAWRLHRTLLQCFESFHLSKMHSNRHRPCKKALSSRQLNLGRWRSQGTRLLAVAFVPLTVTNWIRTRNHLQQLCKNCHHKSEHFTILIASEHGILLWGPDYKRKIASSARNWINLT